MVAKTKRQRTGALQAAIARLEAAGDLSGPGIRALRLFTAFHAFLRFAGGGAKTARCKARQPTKTERSPLLGFARPCSPFREKKSVGRSLACDSGRSLQAF